MAQIFHYGPYSFVGNLPPGSYHSWYFGPWNWWRNVIAVTAHSYQTIDGAPHGPRETLEVTDVYSDFRISGPGRFVTVNVRNVGSNPVYAYEVWLGGVMP